MDIASQALGQPRPANEEHSYAPMNVSTRDEIYPVIQLARESLPFSLLLRASAKLRGVPLDAADSFLRDGRSALALLYILRVLLSFSRNDAEDRLIAWPERCL